MVAIQILSMCISFPTWANTREFGHIIYVLARLKFILKLEMLLSVLGKHLGASYVNVCVWEAVRMCACMCLYICSHMNKIGMLPWRYARNNFKYGFQSFVSWDKTAIWEPKSCKCTDKFSSQIIKQSLLSVIFEKNTDSFGGNLISFSGPFHLMLLTLGRLVNKAGIFEKGLPCPEGIFWGRLCVDGAPRRLLVTLQQV